jgi:hypothetical protein
MRALILWSCAMAVTACVDGPTGDLPLVAAPIVPPATTRPSAELLTSVGPTTLTGAPGSSSVVQVQATKADGTPVGGVLIVFEVQLGGGDVEPATAETATDGIASTRWTFGDAPGVNLMKATGGFVSTPLSFTGTAIAASASQASLRGEPR